ncbi:MAG: traSA:integrase fusion protein, partial [Naasia sp.]|nr:traSA:integrase fusion protein [Naasia sp.]
FKSAAADRLIASSPCVRIALPKATATPVIPLNMDQVDALYAAMPVRYRVIITCAVGLGLRQGEIFGLTRDRVRFLERQVLVEEQLQLLPGGPPFLAPPKTARSRRSVPLPQVVADELAAHIAGFPDGGSMDLVFTAASNGEGIRRTSFHSSIWTAALKKAGLPVGTRFHVLRHTYASLLIEAGEHPKVIQERLGHASITETMDTYGHLFPTSEEKTRQVIDRAFRRDDAGEQDAAASGDA